VLHGVFVKITGAIFHGSLGPTGTSLLLHNKPLPRCIQHGLIDPILGLGKGFALNGEMFRDSIDLIKLRTHKQCNTVKLKITKNNWGWS